MLDSCHHSCVSLVVMVTVSGQSCKRIREKNLLCTLSFMFAKTILLFICNVQCILPTSCSLIDRCVEITNIIFFLLFERMLRRGSMLK